MLWLNHINLWNHISNPVFFSKKVNTCTTDYKLLLKNFCICLKFLNDWELSQTAKLGLVIIRQYILLKTALMVWVSYLPWIHSTLRIWTILQEITFIESLLSTVHCIRKHLVRLFTNNIKIDQIHIKEKTSHGKVAQIYIIK